MAFQKTSAKIDKGLPVKFPVTLVEAQDAEDGVQIHGHPFPPAAFCLIVLRYFQHGIFVLLTGTRDCAAQKQAQQSLRVLLRVNLGVQAPPRMPEQVKLG